MRSILITGGCGFVGSALAVGLRERRDAARVRVFDNLKRRGSELNIAMLRSAGIEFVHGDIRSMEDVRQVGGFDCLIECSAEPSVLTGYSDSPRYAVDTNLVGTVNCLEAARANDADFIFLSTSRVYPYRLLGSLNIIEGDTRYDLAGDQSITGASEYGIAEDFPLTGPRSLYGATKLASELLISEYVDMYDLRAVVNRCGLIAGPGQFGKVDQGVVVLWLARHYWALGLQYIGFNGSGKQVRDILHIGDLVELVDLQVNTMDDLKGETYNVGGGREFSLSLLEMTGICEGLTGRQVNIERVGERRPADLPVYISDVEKVARDTGWRPTTRPEKVFEDVHTWLREKEHVLADILLQSYPQ